MKIVEKKRVNSSSGFTLVELMVVVAIIGILSAVAIPNFKKYQAKSKTSEAKLALAAIYMAETSFMGDADIYATCLFEMGYVPGGGNVTAYNANDGSDTRFYNVGFLTPGTGGGTPNGITCTQSQRVYYGTKGGTSVTNALLPGSATPTTFTASAAGVVSRNFSTNANCSKFTMNERKVLKSTAANRGY